MGTSRRCLTQRRCDNGTAAAFGQRFFVTAPTFFRYSRGDPVWHHGPATGRAAGGKHWPEVLRQDGVADPRRCRLRTQRRRGTACAYMLAIPVLTQLVKRGTELVLGIRSRADVTDWENRLMMCASCGRPILNRQSPSLLGLLCDRCAYARPDNGLLRLLVVLTNFGLSAAAPPLLGSASEG